MEIAKLSWDAAHAIKHDCHCPSWQADLDIPVFDCAGFMRQFLNQNIYINTDLPDLHHLLSKLHAKITVSGRAPIRETLSLPPSHVFYLVEKEEKQNHDCNLGEFGPARPCIGNETGARQPSTPAPWALVHTETSSLCLQSHFQAQTLWVWKAQQKIYTLNLPFWGIAHAFFILRYLSLCHLFFLFIFGTF